MRHSERGKSGSYVAATFDVNAPWWHLPRLARERAGESEPRHHPNVRQAADDTRLAGHPRRAIIEAPSKYMAS